MPYYSRLSNGIHRKRNTYHSRHLSRSIVHNQSRNDAHIQGLQRTYRPHIHSLMNNIPRINHRYRKLRNNYYNVRHILRILLRNQNTYRIRNKGHSKCHSGCNRHTRDRMHSSDKFHNPRRKRQLHIIRIVHGRGDRAEHSFRILHHIPDKLLYSQSKAYSLRRNRYHLQRSQNICHSQHNDYRRSMMNSCHRNQDRFQYILHRFRHRYHRVLHNHRKHCSFRKSLHYLLHRCNKGHSMYMNRRLLLHNPNKYRNQGRIQNSFRSFHHIPRKFQYIQCNLHRMNIIVYTHHSCCSYCTNHYYRHSPHKFYNMSKGRLCSFHIVQRMQGKHRYSQNNRYHSSKWFLHSYRSYCSCRTNRYLHHNPYRYHNLRRSYHNNYRNAHHIRSKL